MATTTTNLGLTLPVGAEKVSRTIINNNNTIIDTATGKLSTLQTSAKSNLVAAINELSGQISTLNGKIANLNGLKVKAGTVASGSTVSVTYETCAFINCFRGSTSAIPVVAFCDGWSGVIYAHQNSSLCTISVSSKTVTITNAANAYVTYLIQYV